MWQTEVTEEGVAKLEQALPGLAVVRGVDLDKLAASLPPPPEPPKPKVDLKWIATSSASDAPKSKNGINTQVIFENKSTQRVKVYWVSYGGELKLYGELDPGGTRQQNSYSKNTWLIADNNDQPLGYFLIDTDEIARAVIPKLN